MFPVRYLLLPLLILALLKVAIGLCDAYRDFLSEQRRQAIRNEYCENDHELSDHFADECDIARRVVEDSIIMRTLELFAERSKSCLFFECGEGADAFFNSWFFISATAMFFTFLIYGGASNLTDLFVAARHSNGSRKCRLFNLKETETEDEDFLVSHRPCISSRTFELDRNTNFLLETMKRGATKPLDFENG